MDSDLRYFLHSNWWTEEIPYNLSFTDTLCDAAEKAKHFDKLYIFGSDTASLIPEEADEVYELMCLPDDDDEPALFWVGLEQNPDTKKWFLPKDLYGACKFLA